MSQARLLAMAKWLVAAMLGRHLLLLHTHGLATKIALPFSLAHLRIAKCKVCFLALVQGSLISNVRTGSARSFRWKRSANISLTVRKSKGRRGSTSSAGGRKRRADWRWCGLGSDRLSCRRPKTLRRCLRNGDTVGGVRWRTAWQPGVLLDWRWRFIVHFHTWWNAKRSRSAWRRGQYIISSSTATSRVRRWIRSILTSHTFCVCVLHDSFQFWFRLVLLANEVVLDLHQMLTFYIFRFAFAASSTYHDGSFGAHVICNGVPVRPKCCKKQWEIVRFGYTPVTRCLRSRLPILAGL